MEEDDGSPTQDDGKRPGLGSLSSVLPRVQRGPWREWVAPLSLVPRGKVTFLIGMGCPSTAVSARLRWGCSRGRLPL